MVRTIHFDFESVPVADAHEGRFGGVPRGAGVFRILGHGGKLLLLEKTHNLAARLERFYSETPDPGGLDLREISERIEFSRTDSPFESLYLLYLERRRAFPATYRKMKTFPLYYLIAVDPRDRFPRVELTRRIRAGARHFGPLRNRLAGEHLRSLVERAYRIRSCEYDIRGDDPYPDCLYFQMHTCSRPCNGDIDRATYLEDVEAALRLMVRGEDPAIAGLVETMDRQAAETRFEEAEQTRLRIERVRKAGAEIRDPVFEVERFDYVAVMKARRKADRKVALIRGGRIVRLEEHAVATIGETLEASIEASLSESASGNPEEITEFNYDEFCLTASVLDRRPGSHRFLPLTDPAETSARVAGLVTGLPGER
jgi:excinuclease UvrABC nuclease subunit